MFNAAVKKMENVMKYAPVYRLRDTFEDLQKRVSNSPSNLEKMEKRCDDLQKQPVLPFTSRYVTKDNVLVACYLGYRWKDAMVSAEHHTAVAHSLTRPPGAPRGQKTPPG